MDSLRKFLCRPARAVVAEAFRFVTAYESGREPPPVSDDLAEWARRYGEGRDEKTWRFPA